MSQSSWSGYGLLVSIGVLAFIVMLSGCEGDKGNRGPAGSSGDESTPTEISPRDDAPGVSVEILEVLGGRGSEGRFRSGDDVTIRFSVKKANEEPWDVSEFGFARALVSGPTFNYQRVLEEQSDLATEVKSLGDGVYEYTFPDPIPSTYLPPLNDTESFGADDGELTGEDLLDGTYTVGLYFSWDYSVEGDSYRDVGNATADFLYGPTSTLDPRQVVTMQNCDQCHDTLQAHGGLRRDVTLCLLCHTAGSEDRNNPDVLDGTPGASVEFSTMIHRIHNGAHLPSVLGVTTRANGSRDYSATPKPYQLVGFRDSVHDYSEVAFPVWPNLTNPMPRDSGYSDLEDEEQDLEDAMRTGVTSCEKCHGDPDGESGPLLAPSDGTLAYSQPSRKNCASCHDDWDPDLPYTANDQTMPSQATDQACIQCHEVSGSALDVMDAHLHPLENPAFNPGINITVVRAKEAGPNNGNGSFDAGERVQVTLQVRDDEGNDVDVEDINRLSLALSGPTTSPQLLLSTDVPLGVLSGSQPFRFRLPESQSREFLGDSTSSLGDTFSTSRTPLWDDSGASTTVYVRGATGGGATSTTADSVVFANVIEVADPLNFERNDAIVINDGTMLEEYAVVTLVEADRLWISPPLRMAQDSGVSVSEVTLTEVDEGVHYSLNTANGMITELIEFGDGNAVVASYTTDFQFPDVYGPPLNDSPDLDESWGEWTGKSLVDGTYRLGFWARRVVEVDLYDESQTYRAPSPSSEISLLYGSALEVQAPLFVDSGQTCVNCHNDVYFHGNGRRGFDNCTLCHSIAGGEDRARYVAGNAPATTGATIDFRTMIHKIHHGAELDKADEYVLVGFGGAAAPNNYSTVMFDHVEFPIFPSGTKNCRSCHGQDNTAWIVPSDRSHPTEQLLPLRAWSAACASCHDSDAAVAHIESQTSPAGAEACDVCHGSGKALSVDIVHKVR